MQKIGIIGVHGSGKTSLAYLLSAHFKMQGMNVKLIHESVRENCPFPINSKASQDTCLWNFHKQFLNELDAKAQGYQLAICDRSVLDTFVYFHAVNKKRAITESAMLQASQWLVTYDVLVCLEPSESTGICDDGIRETDIDYQCLIRDGFRGALAKYKFPIEKNTFFISSDEVFDKDECGRIIERIESKLFQTNPVTALV